MLALRRAAERNGAASAGKQAAVDASGAPAEFFSLWRPPWDGERGAAREEQPARGSAFIASLSSPSPTARELPPARGSAFLAALSSPSPTEGDLPPLLELPQPVTVEVPPLLASAEELAALPAALLHLPASCRREVESMAPPSAGPAARFAHAADSSGGAGAVGQVSEGFDGGGWVGLLWILPARPPQH